MRNVRLLLGSGLVMGALVLIGMAVAQSPDKKGGPPQDKQGGPPRGPDGFGGRGGPRGIERALDDLKLTDKKKDKAEAIVKAYEENVRKLQDLAKSDLLVKLKDILSEQELKTFTAALDQQPGSGGRGGPGGRGGRGPGFGRGLTADQIVERIMSLDKNGDGKITKDELPERMQFLIELGDTNKDGALDKEEIKKLAAKFEKEGLPTGFGGPGAPGGRGAGGPGNRGTGGSGVDGFRGPGGPRNVERAVDGLNLSGQKKDKAEAIIKAHEENVRKLQDLAKSDLLQKMKGVLSERELKTFEEALNRQPGPGGPGSPGGDRRGPGGQPGNRRGSGGPPDGNRGRGE